MQCLVTIGSGSSSSSSQSDEAFSVEGLSSAQKYRKLSNAINQAFAANKMSRDLQEFTKQQIGHIGTLFPITEDQMAPLTIGIGTGAGTGVVTEAGWELIQSSSQSTAQAVRIATIQKIPSDSTIQLSGKHFAAFILGLGATCGVTYSVMKYRQFAERMRRVIHEAFLAISSTTTTREALLVRVNRIIADKDSSWFNRWFEHYNPIPLTYLLLVKGIALDSALEPAAFEQAQQQYNLALAYASDDFLRNVIHLMFARSLRISQGDLALVLDRLNQIPDTSPIHILADLERRIANGEQEVLDDTQIPFDFLCPITQEVMDRPVFYEVNGYRYRFEESAIRAWLTNRATCPLTRQALALQDLQSDVPFAVAIRTWEQTKIIRT